MSTKTSDMMLKRLLSLLWLTFLCVIFTSEAYVDICDQPHSSIYCSCDITNRENTVTCFIFNDIQSDDNIWISLGDVEDVVSLNLHSRLPIRITYIPTEALQRMSHLQTLAILEGNLGTLESNAVADLKSLLELELERNDITGLERDAITRLPKLKKLALSENLLQELLAESLTQLLELEQLFLDRNNISRIESYAFCELQNLKELELWGNRITDLTEYTFRGLRYLKRLDLYKNKIKILSEKIFQSMPNLVEIDLKDNLIHYMSKTAFVGLGKLQRLMLNSNKIKTLPDDIFKPLPNLRSLDLYNNELEFIQVQVVDNMANVKDKHFSFMLKENPFNCDCRLLWVKIYLNMIKSPLFLRELQEMQCQAEDKSVSLQLVYLLELQCQHSSPTTAKSTSMVATSQSSTEATQRIPVQLQKSNRSIVIDNAYFSDDDDENENDGYSRCSPITANFYWTVFVVLTAQFLRYCQETCC